LILRNKYTNKLIKKSHLTLIVLRVNTVELFSKRDAIIIGFFTLLGIAGVFAAGLITVSAPDAQGAGYVAATSCDENITINKEVVFDLPTKRYLVTTISISGVDQRFDVSGINGCGNKSLEMAIPINGLINYTTWYIPSLSISGSNIFTFGAASLGDYQSNSTLTPFDVTNFNGLAVRVISGQIQCIVGSSAACPATSPQEIYNLYGTTTDGTYYLKVNGSARQVYLLMNQTNSDGGGWVLLMKGAPGSTTFTYSTAYWTSSATTLNETLLSNDVNNDAKFSVFNDLSVQKLLAVFKPGSASGSYAYDAGTYGIPIGGDIANNAFNGHVWVETLTAVTTAQSQLNTTNIIYSPASSIPKTKYFQSSAAGASQVFGYETPAGSYGFNVLRCSAQSNLRWGFQWNENGENDYATCDMWGGIGGTWTSANDSVGWNGSSCPSVCAAPGTAMGHKNLSFQIWGKVAAPTLNPVEALAASTTSRTATLSWDPPNGATPSEYLVQYKTSGAAWSSSATVVVTGQTSASITGLSTGTTYNFRIISRTASDSTSVSNISNSKSNINITVS
jgi:hypothetical protein